MLTPGEAPPVRVIREMGSSPFVLTADHAGRRIPAALGDLGVSESERSRHIAWDIGIAGVTACLADRLDAAAVLQEYSRLVIDCNRDPSWPSAMPDISEYTLIPGNRGLTDVQRQARADAIFHPYHDRITHLLDARLAAGQRTIIVAMHSFTPVFKGEARAMEVGVLYHQPTRLALTLLDLLRAEDGLTIGENAPYALTPDSDYSIPFHAERRGLEHVEIEIRQDLITSPEGQAAWADRFSRLLGTALTLLSPR